MKQILTATIVALIIGSVAYSAPTFLGASFASLQGTTGESIAAGEVVSFDDVAGSPRVFKADADGTPVQRTNPIGVAVLAASSGGVVQIIADGEVPIPDAEWDSVPGTADVGKRAYLSKTAGNLTLTAPSSAGDTVIRVGVVTRGGAGAVKITIQVGEGTVL